jgi:SH3-like domain-containing protein
MLQRERASGTLELATRSRNSHAIDAILSNLVLLRFAAILLSLSAVLFCTAPLTSALAVQTDSDSPRSVSGYPVPRFVSLKSDRVNLRKGPGEDFPVDWVYQRRGLPVEIIAEFDNWRRIQDSEGTRGWVHKQLLDGERTALIRGTQLVTLHASPADDAPAAAYAQPGLVAHLSACQGEWCKVVSRGYEGWVKRAQIWGVYPDETVED